MYNCVEVYLYPEHNYIARSRCTTVPLRTDGTSRICAHSIDVRSFVFMV